MQKAVHSFEYGSLQGERVKLPPHLPLKRVINHLMLLYAAFAPERFTGDARREMVAIARHIHNNDMGVRECLPDKALNLRSSHCHRRRSKISEHIRVWPSKIEANFKIGSVSCEERISSGLAPPRDFGTMSFS